MYAIIATGGKQYKVAEGDVIRVEKLGAEAGAAVGSFLGGVSGFLGGFFEDYSSLSPPTKPDSLSR